MDEKMTSGEIAKKAGVSQKAVRLYDEKGLLKPTEYSEGNYRLYDKEALEILEKIVALKQIGFSLEEIRDNLAAGDAKDIEEERLGIIIQGNLIDNKVKHISVKGDFYVLKGILLQILSKLGFEMGRISLKENDLDTVHFHPYQSAVLYLGNQVLCIFGKLHPNYLKSLKLFQNNSSIY